jgi:hypothetical protein
MTLCSEILSTVSSLDGVDITYEETPYDTVERLQMRIGSKKVRLTLITADVCTCHAEIDSVRRSFFTAHEFALYMENLGATFYETSDTDESPMADGPTVLTDANGEE